MTMGIPRVESDALKVIRQIQGKGRNWRNMAIIRDILCLANISRRVTRRAISRKANECAIWIAIQTRQGLRLDDWVSRPPTHFLSINNDE